MRQNETLLNVINLAAERRLGEALSLLDSYLQAHPQLQSDMEKLQAVNSDYELLLHYWQQGFNDPERDKLYFKLLRRLYTLASNMLLNDHLRNSPFMRNLYSQPRQSGREWSVSAIRAQLEDYVSAQAMLELEPPHTRLPKSHQLHEQHARFMDDLFDYIVTSRLWSEATASAFEAMLLSPTVDLLDRQLIVSAVSLSVMQAFGYHKFSVLCSVYEQADDEALRQRALVGWVMSLGGMKPELYPEVARRVETLCLDDATLQALTELQMQLFYCMEAEDDGRRIHDEIIPDIMKGSHLRMTRQGLEENDEDSLEDILHPEAAEQHMEQMEQSMHRMADMQRSGADIYFGGFSQMKRFPFFSRLSAWFVPFYPQHPAVSDIWENTKGKRFLETVTKIGAFCDSDKYSFVLAFRQVLDRIPQSMLSMVEQGEASPIPLGGQIADDEQRQPAFQRRLYLQNLYRFHRLFSVRSEFVDPFADASRYVFFANPAFRLSRLQEHAMEVAAFLFKRKRTRELTLVLDSIDPARRDYNYYIMRARVEAVGDEQRRLYQQALRLRNDAEQALAGWARCCFDVQAYDDAIEAYQKLVDMQPERLSYQLSLAACMANADRTTEAEPLLFKLNYLHPDNLNVVRILAWTLMNGAKYDQAERYYEQLGQSQSVPSDDIVNHAFCLWLNGKTSDALKLLNTIDDKTSVAESIAAERSFLLGHGLLEVDLQLMLDSLGLSGQSAALN